MVFKGGPLEMLKISVIIPTLGDSKYLKGAVESATEDGVEVIVVKAEVLGLRAVDGEDDLFEEIEALGARVVTSLPGRGLQMDIGAEHATGEVLLFLHADARVKRGWSDKVRSVMETEGAVGGAFTFAVNSTKTQYRYLERLVALRVRKLGLIYGDQAIFVASKVFKEVGGYMGLPLMEDVDLVRRLKPRGRFFILKQWVRVSPRRWDRLGILKTSLRNWAILLLYYIGVSPKSIYTLYYGKRL
jgi:rSAM/selenodomain-associated transferase 2